MVERKETAGGIEGNRPEAVAAYLAEVSWRLRLWRHRRLGQQTATGPGRQACNGPSPALWNKTILSQTCSMVFFVSLFRCPTLLWVGARKEQLVLCCTLVSSESGDGFLTAVFLLCEKIDFIAIWRDILGCAVVFLAHRWSFSLERYAQFVIASSQFVVVMYTYLCLTLMWSAITSSPLSLVSNFDPRYVLVPTHTHVYVFFPPDHRS